MNGAPGCGCTGTCGCFTGIAVSTPAPVVNLPGLQAIRYRSGTHATFLASMLANLSLLADSGALLDLRARDEGDAAVALLDAWAAVADVLTFYSERIANENYLRTATERRSVLELARAVGYELSAGVAAGAYLAFTMQDARGAAPSAPLPAGIKVQSVPRPGEVPVTFETTEAAEGRPAWNALRPRQANPPDFTGIDQSKTNKVELVFAGTATNLKQGDGLLFGPPTTSVHFGVVAGISTVPSGNGIPGQGTTTVTVTVLPNTASLSGFPSPSAVDLPPSVTQLQQQTGNTVSSTDLTALAAREKDFSIAELFACLAQSASGPQQAVALRTKAAIFGNNAPPYDVLPPNLTHFGQRYKDDRGNSEFVAGTYKDRSTWTNEDLGSYSTRRETTTAPRTAVTAARTAVIETATSGTSASAPTVLLDTVYPQAAAGQYAVLQKGDTWAATTLASVRDTSTADFTMSAKVTELTVDSTVQLSNYTIAGTTVYVGADVLTLAEMPITAAVTGTAVLLDGWVEGLQPGQWIAVRGSRADYPGADGVEVTQLKQVEYQLDPDKGGTQITCAPPLALSYTPSSVFINANVVPGTHGETVTQVLGSGDASTPFQRFALNNQAPLTYVSAASSAGAQSTLSIQVSGVKWQETPYLYGRGPGERVYVTRIADGGAVTVEGGDGIMGARFPTGRENIRVLYRKGTGLPGLLKAGQLTLLTSPVPGVRAVTNPVDATGAADPEVLADARVNAPLSALTLGRVVSLRDYQDFARTFPGIAKSLATWSVDGPARGVMVTIAGPGGEALPSSSQIYLNLLAALQAAGDPYVPLRLVSYTPATFTVAALVKVDPAYDPDEVIGAARAALQVAFSFQARDFGQNVAASQVLRTIQSVDGVLAVKLTSLARAGSPSGLPAGDGLLPASLPTSGGALASLTPAELLLIDPGPADLGVM
jgi:predicted phage baseplate assembly protein